VVELLLRKGQRTGSSELHLTPRMHADLVEGQLMVRLYTNKWPLGVAGAKVVLVDWSERTSPIEDSVGAKDVRRLRMRTGISIVVTASNKARPPGIAPLATSLVHKVVALTLTAHLHDFVDAYGYGRRLKTLKGLTPSEYICKC
jgi:hypothetical protein